MRRTSQIKVGLTVFSIMWFTMLLCVVIYEIHVHGGNNCCGCQQKQIGHEWKPGKWTIHTDKSPDFEPWAWHRDPEPEQKIPWSERPENQPKREPRTDGKTDKNALNKVTKIPEPGTMLLMTVGLVWLLRRK